MFKQVGAVGAVTWLGSPAIQWFRHVAVGIRFSLPWLYPLSLRRPFGAPSGRGVPPGTSFVAPGRRGLCHAILRFQPT